MTGRDTYRSDPLFSQTEGFHLQAVTICINYADYLKCIVQNARHFDRWLVLTVSEDHETKEVCAAHGLECYVSTLLRPDGTDFHAVTNKAPILNEGLERFGNHGWALVLDADVLLPRHFRRRLEGLPLEPGYLYGMAGRKFCS